MLCLSWLEEKLSESLHWLIQFVQASTDLRTDAEYSELYLIVLLCWNLAFFDKNVNYPAHNLLFHKLLT